VQVRLSDSRARTLRMPQKHNQSQSERGTVKGVLCTRSASVSAVVRLLLDSTVRARRERITCTLRATPFARGKAEGKSSLTRDKCFCCSSPLHALAPTAPALVHDIRVPTRRLTDLQLLGGCCSDRRAIRLSCTVTGHIGLARLHLAIGGVSGAWIEPFLRWDTHVRTHRTKATLVCAIGQVVWAECVVA
jgi:hypothetical protein